MLRTPELKPFIIYVRPPPFDVLKETRHQVDVTAVFIIIVIVINIIIILILRHMRDQHLMRLILALSPMMSLET